MNIKQFAGVDSLYVKEDGTQATHSEIFGKVVDAIGPDKLLQLVPAKPKELAALYAEDCHLNNVPLKLWDRQQYAVADLLRGIGISSISLSDTVCTLKMAARIYATGKTWQELAEKE